MGSGRQVGRGRFALFVAMLMAVPVTVHFTMVVSVCLWARLFDAGFGVGRWLVLRTR